MKYLGKITNEKDLITKEYADNLLDDKVDKEDGKGLSTNDYTTDDKTKLSGIATGAEVNVQADWNVTDTTSDAYINNKPTIPDTSIYVTATDPLEEVDVNEINADLLDGRDSTYFAVDSEVVKYTELGTTEVTENVNATTLDGHDADYFKDADTLDGHDSSYFAVAPTVLTGTLTAGETSITLESDKITTDSIVDIYTSKFGVSPTGVTTSAGSIVITFDSLEEDMSVRVEVK